MTILYHNIKHFGRKFIFIFSALTLIFITSCSSDRSSAIPENQIIARVGERIITASEFKTSYEFSLSSVRRGKNPRRTYLDYMIKEALLSNEGYKQGYHKSYYVTSRVKNRRYNNLLEAYYLKHVHDKVKISEDELKESIKKSTVKWRMIIWPTQSLEEAEKVRLKAENSSLENYIDNELKNQETKLKIKKNFETDWLDFLSMPPEIFNEIKDLEVGKTSKPIPFNNGYALFQILDINLEGITENQLIFGPKRKKIEERLHNIQADKIVHHLMDSVLTPLDIRVKGKIVNQISPLLFKWYQDTLPPNNSLFNFVNQSSDSSVKYIRDLKKMLSETLVSYKDGTKTVEDYLNYMNYYRSPFRIASSEKEFYDILITEIGSMMKNDIFVQLAEKEGFGDSANIKLDLKLWEQKWTYDAYRMNKVKEIKISEADAQHYFKHRWRELDIADIDTTRFYKYRDEVFSALIHEKQLQKLKEELENLYNNYPIWINEKRLSELDLIDSPKATQTSLFVRKNFSFEEVIPTVDMKWIHL
jgi:hypothetical protein